MGITGNDNTDNSIIFAVDVSGSTQGYKSYWDRVSQLYDSVKNDKPIIILWDSKSRIATEVELDREIRSLCYTRGGTTPAELAKLCVQKKLAGTLYLITDGQVSQSDVDKTDTALGGHQFKQVYAHLLQTGSSINLSVTAPFTRSTEFEIFVDANRIGQGDSAKVIDLSVYATPAEFLADFPSLKSIIAAQNLGRNNTVLRNDLLELQKRLLAVAAKEASKSSDSPSRAVEQALSNNNYDEAVEAVKKCIASYYSVSDDVPSQISRSIQELVRACTSVGNYSFDLLQTSRAARAENVQVVAVDQVEQLDVSGESFECPIYYEQDLPALLLAQLDAPVLSGQSKDVIDYITNCPLFLLNFPDLVEQVKRAIDHPIGCNSLKVNNGIFEKSPMTRREIGGAVPMGDTEAHCKAANWSLARLFTGGKLLGNVDLWFAVLYIIAKERVPYLQENQGLFEAMERQLRYRLTRHTSYIALSGLAEFPLVRVPVGVALWYCVASGEFYGEDPNNFEKDRLRALASVARYMINMIDLLGYPYKKEYTLQRLEILKAWSYIMNNKMELKRIGDHLRSQYQNHIYLPQQNNAFVFLDGGLEYQNVSSEERAPPLPEQLQGLPLSIVLHLFELADPQKKISAVLIPKKLKENAPQPKINYGYNIPKTQDSPTIICPLTLRPYGIDPVKHKAWLECSVEVFGPIEKQLSGFRYYLMYFETNKTFPTREEYLMFVAAREAGKEKNPRDTLPAHAAPLYQEIHTKYEDALARLETHLGKRESTEELVARVRRSSSLEDRIRQEQEWKQ